FFEAEVGIRAGNVTGVQTCALPIARDPAGGDRGRRRDDDRPLAGCGGDRTPPGRCTGPDTSGRTVGRGGVRDDVNTEDASGDNRIEQIHEALSGVMDPEIHRPITELGMVDEVTIDAEGTARVRVLLTIEGCPMRDRIEREAAEAAATVPGLSR